MAKTPDVSQRLVLTLCIVQEGSKVLLGMKKKGFGQGRWNGFGGKVEIGETIEEAAHRELQEEAGIGVMHLEKAGEMEFTFTESLLARDVHIFRGTGVIGKPTETEEMRPQWFERSALPYNAMWVSDVCWFPFFLEKKKFQGRVLFDDERTMIEHDVRPL